MVKHSDRRNSRDNSDLRFCRLRLVSRVTVKATRDEPHCRLDSEFGFLRVPNELPGPPTATILSSAERLQKEFLRIDQELAASLPRDSWDLDYATAARQFAAAFRDYGWDVMQASPAELRAKLGVEPPETQTMLMYALLHWELVATAAQDRHGESLRELLWLIDDNPWLQQFLAARTAPNANPLLKLAEQTTADIPAEAQRLLLEALTLRDLLDRPESTKFLSQAGKQLGNNFWLQLRLAQMHQVKAERSSGSTRRAALTDSLAPLRAAYRQRPLEALQARLLANGRGGNSGSNPGCDSPHEGGGSLGEARRSCRCDCLTETSCRAVSGDSGVAKTLGDAYLATGDVRSAKVVYLRFAESSQTVSDAVLKQFCYPVVNLRRSWCSGCAPRTRGQTLPPKRSLWNELGYRHYQWEHYQQSADVTRHGCGTGPTGFPCPRQPNPRSS